MSGSPGWVVRVGSTAEELKQGPERRPSGRGSHQAPMSVPRIYTSVGERARVIGGCNGVTLDRAKVASTVEAFPSESTRSRADCQLTSHS